MFLEIASLVFASVLFLWVYLSQRRPKNFPPGPMGIPIFGNLPFMGSEPHKKLGEIGNKYGDVFSLHYGSYPIVVLNTLPVIREAFRKDAFSGRPNHLLAMELSRDGITFQDGPAGYEQRRFTLKTLRDLGFGKQSMEKSIQEEVKELIEYFGKYAGTGTPVEIRHVFGIFVINSLWAILAGEKFSVTDPKIQKLYRICIEGFIDPEVAGSLWFLPLIAKLFPNKSGYNKVQEAVQSLRQLIRSVIEEHKKTYLQGTYRDFIDVYLEKIYATSDPNSSFYKEVGENNLVHVLIDLFTAGSDTLNSSLNFAILYLSNNKLIMEKVQYEIDTVCGRSKLPDSEDRRKMPYTEAVICEVLRHSSIVCGAILHSTTENTTISKYHLKKGTIVMANLYNVHHDLGTWGDPEKFRPERFLKKVEGVGTRSLGTLGTLGRSQQYQNLKNEFQNTQYVFVKNDNLVPFSAGKRICLAESMAQTEFFIFLSGLLQHFDFTFPQDQVPMEEDVAPGLVLSPKPFKILIEHRA